MKKLLISTAIVAATSAPLFAQNADGMFRQEAGATELHASDFIGMRVYRADAVDSEAYEGVQDGWDVIGEIKDVVFSREGSVEAVLVDIGGFLGIGENQVAVDMDAIEFVSDSATPDQTSDFFLVLNAPRSAIENAPTYEAMDGEAAGMGDHQGAEMTDDNSADAESAAMGGKTDDQEMAVQTDEMTGNDATASATPDAGATDGQRSSGTGLARQGYVTATEGDIVAEKLTGAAAYDTNDRRIGEVSELLLAENGKINSAIVDVGGFLGIGEKPVKLHMSKLDILRAEDGRDVRIYVSMSEEELEALPEYEQ